MTKPENNRLQYEDKEQQNEPGEAGRDAGARSNDLHIRGGAVVAGRWRKLQIQIRYQPKRTIPSQVLLGLCAKGLTQGIEDNFVVSDGIDIGYGKKIPLWLFGLLY